MIRTAPRQTVSEEKKGRVEMTRRQLALARGAIEVSLARELRESSRLREAITIERSSDPLDSVIASGERDLACIGLEASRKRIIGFEEALVRIERGAYGICANCEEEIAQKRLVATERCATLCIECQDVQEQARAAKVPVGAASASYGQWALA